MKPSVVNYTITSGQTVGPVLELGGLVLVGIVAPSTFDGTGVTIQVSLDNSTYVTLIDPSTGAAVPATVAASKAWALSYELMRPWLYAKLVAGTAQSTTDTTFQLSLIPNY